MGEYFKKYIEISDYKLDLFRNSDEYGDAALLGGVLA